MILRILRVNPSERPNIEQIFKHDWFKKFNFFRINDKVADEVNLKMHKNKDARYSHFQQNIKNIESATASSNNITLRQIPENHSKVKSRSSSQNVLKNN